MRTGRPPRSRIRSARRSIAPSSGRRRSRGGRRWTARRPPPRRPAERRARGRIATTADGVADPRYGSPVTTAVLDDVPGQEGAIAFLRGAVARPHHAYVFAGPEGSGKSLAARAFAAALLCRRGGCGDCPRCPPARQDHHPNEFVVEPEGRDIHVDTIRTEVWQPAYRTAPEPGRKVFVIREADRLSPPAADTLLKVLEEPPADAVLLLLSARAHELPETVQSRCHVIAFTALPEAFVVDELVRGGADEVRARLAARLAGGNVGRARRLATSEEGLAFRDAAGAAVELGGAGPAGALAAAGGVLAG